MTFNELYFISWVTFLEKELFHVEIKIIVNQAKITPFWVGKNKCFYTTEECFNGFVGCICGYGTIINIDRYTWQILSMAAWQWRSTNFKFLFWNQHSTDLPVSHDPLITIAWYISCYSARLSDYIPCSFNFPSIIVFFFFFLIVLKKEFSFLCWIYTLILNFSVAELRLQKLEGIQTPSRVNKNFLKHHTPPTQNNFADFILAAKILSWRLLFQSALKSTCKFRVYCMPFPKGYRDT